MARKRTSRTAGNRGGRKGVKKPANPRVVKAVSKAVKRGDNLRRQIEARIEKRLPTLKRGGTRSRRSPRSRS